MGDLHDVAWQPQPGSQVLFLSCPIYEVLYEGTRGPGKTDALLMDFVQHVGQGLGADWRGILFRRTYTELKDVIAKTQKWFKKFFPGAEYNKTEKTWTFPDGEQLVLSYMRTVDDYWNYHGHAYPWIGWEELTNWPDDGCFRKMMSCSRSTNPNAPLKYRATCNPYGAGHNWVKRRYRLPGGRGKVIRDSLDQDGQVEPARVAIHGALKENKILLDANPDYVSKLRAAARNAAELKAWLYGSWDIVAGGMFDDVWEPRRHVLRPFPIPRQWRVDRSFDWGSSKPFSVGWWAEADGSDIELPDGRTLHTIKGDLFRIHEWYGCDKREPNVGLRMLAEDVATGIKEREVELFNSGRVQGRIRPGPADTAIWTSEDGPSIASNMGKKGVLWEQADKAPGSRIQGWEEIRTRLSNALPGDGGVREKPGLFVFDTCLSFLETFPVLPRDDKKLDDVDTEAEDHIGDEVRYRVRKPKKGVRSGTM
jgi:hypothetical protein